MSRLRCVSVLVALLLLVAACAKNYDEKVNDKEADLTQLMEAMGGEYPLTKPVFVSCLSFRVKGEETTQGIAQIDAYLKDPTDQTGRTKVENWAQRQCTSDGSLPASAAPPPSDSSLVTYEIEGVGTDVTVTMQTSTGQSQDSVADVSLSVNKHQRWTYEGFQPGAFLYISVQGGDEYTFLTCRIKVDSKVVSENSTHAAYGIATCEGSM